MAADVEDAKEELPDSSAAAAQQRATALPTPTLSTTAGFGYDEVQKRASVAESSVERVPSSASFVGKKISTAVAAAGQKVAKFFFSDDEADEHLDGGLADPESDNWSTVWRFLWWSLRPVIVLPLLIYFCAWVCIKSWQITGAGCYYNTEMISSVLRAQNTEKWGACASLQTEKSCQVERSGCGWNHRGGFCDISELADMKPFEFLLPRLSHYTVSDLLIPFVILGNAGTTWVFFQELLSLWSIQSQLANFALYLAAYLGAFIAYRDSNFSAALFFRIGGGMFAGTAGILIVRPRRVPFRTMAKVLLCASTYTVYAWIGAFFVPVVLRPLQQHMQEEENNYSDLQRGIVELFVANLFSSWYVPLGARIVGKYICKAALVAVEFNYGTLSPTDKFEVEKYMRMLINRGLDVFRYTFGRSVFLKLSPMVIAFLVLKDVVYDVLHFGMGFDPYWRCFLMKLDQSRGVKASEVELPLLFRFFAMVNRINGIINRNEIFNGISYQYEFDCNRSQQVSHSSTDVTFCPTRASMNTRNSRHGAKVSPNRQELQTDMQAVIPSKTDKASTTYTRSFRFANHRITARNIPKLPPFGGMNKRVIEDEDIEKVRPLLEFLQQEIFARFQCRMQVRLYSAVAFLVAPALALAVGDAEFLPGFPRSDDSVTKQDEQSISLDSSYNVALLLFLVTDLVSFFGVFFGVHLNKKWCLQPRQTVLGQLKRSIVRGGMRRFVLFSGNFLLQFAMLGCILTWDPYDMVAVRLRTGVPELGFEHIRRGCVLQYGADGNPMKK